MSVLTKKAILKSLKEGQAGNGLIITPLKQNQIGTSSIDVHLGHEFIVFRRPSITCFDIKGKENKINQNIHRYQQKVRITKEKPFVLHPRQLILGSTREYIVLPSNLSINITGRSTWGRTGLMIATATKVDPGFKGCVTLELINGGVVPLVLYPGLRIAQLVFFTTEGDCEYKGIYSMPTGPEFPALDKELDYLDSQI